MFTEKEFYTIPTEQREVLRNAIADATGQPVAAIGDGHILAFLEKLLPLLLQFLPLFAATKEEGERKIGDGTFLAALMAAFSNPQFMQTIAALIALFKTPAAA